MIIIKYISNVSFFVQIWCLKLTSLTVKPRSRELASVSDAAIITAGTLVSRLGQLKNKGRASQVFGSFFLSVQQKINTLWCLCVKMHVQDNISSVSLKRSLNCRQTRWFNGNALSVSMSQFSATCSTLRGQQMNFD